MSRSPLRLAVITGLLALFPDRSWSYCAPESSPCFRWDRYIYNGDFWCRHWNYLANDQVYCINATTDIGPLTFRDAMSSAYQTWKSQVPILPQLTFSALTPPDTFSVSYAMFVDDATWTARGFPSNAGAITYKLAYNDGTVAHARTWFHLKSTAWGWSPDCQANDCTPGSMTPGKLDFPSLAVHEIGHWWVLNDISTAGCQSVVMWFQISTNQVKRSLDFPDVYGATLLYDQPVDAQVALEAVDVAPDRVSLVWFSAGEGVSGAVERRGQTGAWEVRALVDADGSGRIHFIDDQVTPGSRFCYRLRIGVGDSQQLSEERWLDVPRWDLSILPISPNPILGSDLQVSFVLPSDNPATLDLVDVLGRLVRRLDVGILGRGSHLVSLGRDSPVQPGVYWLRLVQSSSVVTARAVVIR